MYNIPTLALGIYEQYIRIIILITIVKPQPHNYECAGCEIGPVMYDRCLPVLILYTSTTTALRLHFKYVVNTCEIENSATFQIRTLPAKSTETYDIKMA